MAKNPKVSVVTITYNHEAYIKEALDGFVAQKTNFDVEVIVADDCSTDGTPKIIQEYADKYPKLFKPILREKNIGAVKNSISALSSAKGQYIAMCEGDDFWVDPQKLQKQADFLDGNPEYSMCFHPVRVFYVGGEEKDEDFPADQTAEFSLERLIQDNYIQTNSVMYRRQSYEHLPNDILPLDWYLHLYHAKFGKIGFIQDVMAAYRRHPGGMWWGTHRDLDEHWKKYGVQHLGLFAELYELFPEEIHLRNTLKLQIENMFRRLIAVDRKYGTDTVIQASRKYPTAAKLFISNLLNTINDKEKEIEIIQLSSLQTEKALNDIRNSKSLKVGTLLLRPFRSSRNFILKYKVNHNENPKGTRIK